MAPVDPPEDHGYGGQRVPTLSSHYQELAEQIRIESDVRPVWDEKTGRFWCATSLNAYDIPEATSWQQEFREAVGHMTPEVISRLQPSVHLSCVNSLAPANHVVGNNHESPPVTPQRPVRKSIWDSPNSTPPKFLSTSPDNRASRAAHTKALLSMNRQAGVSTFVHGREIAVYRFGGKLFAVNARCPHQGGKLCEGEVGDIEDAVGGRQCYVKCPVHKMQFNLATGEVLEGKCPPLQTYSARIGVVEDGKKVARVEIGFESLTDDFFSFADMTF